MIFRFDEIHVEIVVFKEKCIFRFVLGRYEKHLEIMMKST